jgi:hypothetical protein
MRISRRSALGILATTATASSSFTTFFTPAIVSAGVVSTDTSLPP